jgi:flagellar hook-associated protein 1 FlgK
MGTSDVLSIGVSGALAAQRSLSTASHNIANAQTEGFSRQRVDVGTRPAQLTGVGSLGTGVQVNNVKRVHDDFLSGDMRSNASLATGYQINYDYTSQIDNMLADPQAGLSPTLQSFFSAINNISNDPSSQSARQVLLGEANALSERFTYLDARFDSLRKGTNETLKSQITDVNNLAKAIADVNWKVVLSKEVTQGEPSDLLDQRERLLHRLSEKVVVRTTEQEDGSLNVFVGNGQTLVIGKNHSELGLEKNDHDPSQLEVVYKSQGTSSVVTQFMKGGSIGGLVDFREKILGGAQNELGRIAIGVTKTFNEQHHKGMTLENKLGGDFFNNIDKSTPLTLGRKTNGGDFGLETTITNVDNLTTSDYKLNYNAGLYTLIREEDDKLIDTFTTLPHHIDSEGFTIDFHHGTNIQNGDSFFIRPTRAAAREFSVDIKRTNDIAAASPVRIRTSVHNLGSIEPSINGVADIDAPSFATRQGALSPAITIRFIDENHIELLDDKGKVVIAQQLDEQGKAIPATAAIPADDDNKGSPATPAIPAIAANRTNKISVEGEHDKTENDDDLEVEQLGKVIIYDPDKGINLFTGSGGIDTGYSVKLTGKATAGDTFIIEYNTDAVGDNKNILELGKLQSKKTLDQASSNYSEVYSQLVSRIGSKTHELGVNNQAQNILYEQSKALQQSVSGVNLDEEAADLIKHQKAYEANAKVIASANEMFDTLMSALRR